VDVSTVVKLLGGIGMFLLGIHHLTEGLRGLSGDATTGLAVLGGGITVRRTALAHITYSLIAGVLAMLFLRPLSGAAEWVGARLDDYHGVLALAAFSTIFKLAGIAVFYPWLDTFSWFIVRISGEGSETAVNRLTPTVANAGGAVALEASWRAILEVAHGAADAVRRRLASESVQYEPDFRAVQHIEHFLESLPLETTDLGTIGPRPVRLCHALDHLTELHDDLTQIPAVAGGWQPPSAFEEGATALGTWLDATKEPEATPAPAVSKALEESSKQLAAERKSARAAAATARASLDALVWADGALYHAWRLAESLRIASGK
jgi:phosphate:Na+ symporter